MEDIDKILKEAQMRAESNQLPYKGILTPQEAFAILQADQAAVLLDVRTTAELELVGRIPQAKHVEWAFYPGMVINPDFARELAQKIDQEATLMIICRTGGRSHHAAALAQELGYDNAYNVIEGFEGETNHLNQRTLINGWKHAGLPWTN